MSFLNQLIVPEAMPYLMGVLGLLLIWQFYKLQVLAGRVQAIDFWDRSGVRVFIHATVQDGEACAGCNQANYSVFLPSLAARKEFSTLDEACTNPSGCRCLVVGVYGAWQEAQRVVHYLRKQSKRKALKLTDKAMGNMLGGQWERTISGTSDRISIHMLEAFRIEGSDPEAAIFRYRFVIDQAKAARDLHLVVPAYFRLTDLLERIERPAEALQVIQGFETRYATSKRVAPFPTEAQSGLMSVRKSHLAAKRDKAMAFASN